MTSTSSARTTSATSSWTTALPRDPRCTEPTSPRANQRVVSPWLELNKFDSYPFIKRIYDNGPIQVYDVTALLHPSARAAPAGPPVGGTGLDVGVFLLAAVVAVLWLLRLRRRPGPVHDVEHLVVCGVVGALVIGVFGAFFIRLTHLPPEAIAIVVLLVLLVLSLRPEKRHRPDLTRGDATDFDRTNA